jgi:hypothetical protein
LQDAVLQGKEIRVRRARSFYIRTARAPPRAPQWPPSRPPAAAPADPPPARQEEEARLRLSRAQREREAIGAAIVSPIAPPPPGPHAAQPKAGPRAARACGGRAGGRVRGRGGRIMRSCIRRWGREPGELGTAWAAGRPGCGGRCAAARPGAAAAGVGG